MAKHRAPLRGAEAQIEKFGTQHRDRLHHIAQIILNVSMPPNTVIYMDVCQQSDGSDEPAIIHLDCKPAVDDDYEDLIAQTIIDAFPIQGYVGDCEDDSERLYKCLYHTPESRSPHQMMDEVLEAQSILGDAHTFFTEISKRATAH